MHKNPMVVATRRVTLRDFMIFQVKLALDGLKGLLVIQLSVLAMIVDFVSGRGPRPRYFYSVVRIGERFDAWLNLYGAVQRMDAGESADGLFGASEAGSGSLLGEIEEMVRGGDRAKRARPAA